jgi:hypothetical protein
MAYGRNFGMRSFENVVRDARFRVPSTGSPLVIGSSVMIDAANPGRLKVATEAAAPGPNCGIVVFEHIQNKSDALTLFDDSPYDLVPLGVYAQMMHGVGTKVWFANTASKTLYDGRVRSAFNFVVTTTGTAETLATSQIGSGLVPDGAGKWRLTDGTTSASVGGTAWLVIEQVNPSTGLVEARLAF